MQLQAREPHGINSTAKVHIEQHCALALHAASKQPAAQPDCSRSTSSCCNGTAAGNQVRVAELCTCTGIKLKRQQQHVPAYLQPTLDQA